MGIAPNLVLMGGHDQTSLHASMAHWLAQLNPQRPVLFLPQAWPREAHPRYLSKFLEWLQPHGWPPERVQMWSKLSDAPYSLERFGGVFLAGGNTFDLWHQVTRSGFREELERYINSGQPVGGNSAGALILGRDFRYAHDENHMGMMDCTGCRLLGSICVWAHYDPTVHDTEIQDFIADTGFSVAALTDEGGIEVKGSSVTVIGDSLVLWSSSGTGRYEPGERLSV